MGPFDDAGNVGHHERTAVTYLHDAEIGFQRGEGVVGYLGFRGRYYGEQRGFAGVRESDQPHVGEYLQFQNERPFLSGFARLSVARRLVGRCLEVPVAQTAPSAGEQDEFLTVFRHFAYDFACVGVAGHGAERYGYHGIFAALSRRAGAGTRFTVLGEYVPLVFQVYQRPVLAVAAQDDAAAPSAVAAVGPAESDEFFAPEMSRTGPSRPRTGEYLDVIYEVR